MGAGGTKPAIGTLVQATGVVTEFRGAPEFSYPTRVRQMGPGPTPCAPVVVTVAAVPYNDPARSEPYESVIVEYRNIAITSVSTYAAYFVDESGGQGAISRSSSDHYVPSGGYQVGQRYEYVRGPLLTYYTEYRVYPPPRTTSSP